MGVNIHPLQRESAYMLESLYKDKKLGVTSAMQTILNGYYPSIESILGTLKFYENDNSVSKFVEENIDIIEQAKEEVEKRQQERKKFKSEENDFFGSFDEDEFDFSQYHSPHIYNKIKAIPLCDIEVSLSKELSNICDEELEIKIGSIHPQGDFANSPVDIQITVSNKTRVQ